MEYKIYFAVPASFSDERLVARLPDPTIAGATWTAYAWRAEPDGFYFLDNLGSAEIAARAFRCLVDEALRYAQDVRIEQL